MQKHLDEIGKSIAHGSREVIIFDHAAWHTTNKFELPKNISLLSLPPDSPELNPTEQVWQVLRDPYLGNRCFDFHMNAIGICATHVANAACGVLRFASAWDGAGRFN